MKRILLFCVAVFATSLQANTDVLSVDPVMLSGSAFSFENDAKRYPKQSQFSIVHRAFVFTKR